MSQYLDNITFLAALVEYKSHLKSSKIAGNPQPQISNYIGDCILRIATGLSYRSEFINYTYKDDMILDGIENCILYMDNFDPTIISMGINMEYNVNCAESVDDNVGGYISDDPTTEDDVVTGVTSGATATIIKIRNKPNYGVSLLVKDTIGTFVVGEEISSSKGLCTNVTSIKCSNPYGYFTQIIYWAFVRRIKKEKKQQNIKNALLQNMTFDIFELQEHDDDGHYQNSHVDFLQNIQHDIPDVVLRKKKVDILSTLDDFIEDELEID